MRTLTDVMHSHAVLVIMHLPVTVNKSHKNTKKNYAESRLIAVTSVNQEISLTLQGHRPLMPFYYMDISETHGHTGETGFKKELQRIRAAITFHHLCEEVSN